MTLDRCFCLSLPFLFAKSNVANFYVLSYSYCLSFRTSLIPCKGLHIFLFFFIATHRIVFCMHVSVCMFLYACFCMHVSVCMYSNRDGILCIVIPHAFIPLLPYCNLPIFLQHIKVAHYLIPILQAL